MSIAYLDPGNIESDLRSGALAEFKVSDIHVKFIIINEFFCFCKSPPKIYEMG